ncbi:hypothetical protein Tco_0674209 [Tanacetum coccineum]
MSLPRVEPPSLTNQSSSEHRIHSLFNTNNPNPDTATTPSSSLQNLPNLLFTLPPFPGIVGPLLANKCRKQLDVAVQLKYDRIREESNIENQQFLDSIDEVKVRNSTRALVDAYEADKILLDTYGDTVTIKRPRDREDDDQEPSAGIDQGSKRRRLTSQSAPVEETMQSTDVFEEPAHQEFETGVHDEQAEEEVLHLPDWFQQPKQLPSPDHAWNKSVPAVHESVQPWLSNLARRQDPQESFDELTDTTFDFSAFTNNDKFALWGISHWGKKRRQFYAFATTRESARDVYSKRRIIAVTKVEIVEWQNYKHLDWITVRRDDDILYKFKEGDFHRLRIQDIERHAASSRAGKSDKSQR